MKRRDFIKITGAGAAVAGLAACTPKTGAGKDRITPAALSGKMEEHYPGIGLLGYGCMRWPMLPAEEGKPAEIDQEAVNAMVDEALAHGVTYFDTAPVYLQGKSEAATAAALNRHPRSEWLLATKLSNFSDASFESSVKMYRRSLEVFKTDHIDYYLLHSISGGEVFEKRFGQNGIMDFLLKEREDGHIRNIGFSFHGSDEGFDELMALHDKYHWNFVQIQMNYKDWTHAGRGSAKYLYEQLAERDIPVVIMEPLLGGGLADIPASLADRFKALEPDKSIASWAFRFVGSYPKVLTVLSGMSCMEHLQDNLSTYLDFQPLSEEELALCDEIGGEIAKFPLIGCTACQYCMPCPYGIDIPGIFRFYNKTINEGTYVKTREQQDYARARRKYLALYDKSVETARQADHCISCNRCLKACPQHIRIPAELKRIDGYVEKLKRGEL